MLKSLLQIISGATIIGGAIYSSPKISRVFLNGQQPKDTLLAVATIGAGAYVIAKTLRLA